MQFEKLSEVEARELLGPCAWRRRWRAERTEPNRPVGTPAPSQAVAVEALDREALIRLVREQQATITALRDQIMELERTVTRLARTRRQPKVKPNVDAPAVPTPPRRKRAQ